MDRPFPISFVKAATDYLVKWQAIIALQLKKVIEKTVAFLKFLAAKLKLISIAATLFVKAKAGNFKTSATSSLQLVTPVAKKPVVLSRWLLTSYWFYVSVVLTVILMNTAVSIAIDRSLANIYPPIKNEKLFGLIVEKHEDPRVASQRKMLMGAFWATTCGWNAFVLLACLPGAVRKAQRKARKKEAMADELASVKPSESVILYNKALKLAVDASQESILKDKIDALDNSIKSGNYGQPQSTLPLTASSGGTGTLVLSGNERVNPSEDGNGVGVDGRYQIQTKLGNGAMGVVFLAKDQLLLRDVALKKLTADFNQTTDVVTRFQQEARALARLSHPNIVQIYDFVEEGEQYWIAMEFVAGQDLESRIGQAGKLSLDESLRIGTLVAEAMDYAHNRGVVHRDFKPSNVLITTDGIPKVMDFGLAKLTQSSVATMEGSLLGSPAFMSPEQAKGQTVDERSDIYALGVSLYQMLTGQLPFEGDLKSVLTQKITDCDPSMTPLKTVGHPDLENLVVQMMASEPGERPATMNAVNQALGNISCINN